MASYGEASRAEHIKAGNILPLSAYVDAEPDGSGAPSDEEKSQLETLRNEQKNAAPVAENKALTPAVEEKAPAKRARKRA